MSAKKLFILFGLYFVWLGTAMSQQIAQKTQFYNNPFSINPAVAGTEEFKVPLLFSVRRQWVGINEAPSTQSVSAHGYVGKKLGTGLNFYNDVSGPSRSTGLNIALSNHLQLHRDYWLSFALSLNLYQYQFDPDRLRTDLPDDPAVARLLAQDARLFPDVTSGLYLNADHWFVGLSVTNIFGNNQDIFSSEFNSNTLSRIYYLMAGWKFQGLSYFAIEPNILLKRSASGLTQLDIVAKAYYKDQWLGLSYRTGDALSAILGLTFEQFTFGYSYDFTVSDVNEFSTGTHEVTVGFILKESISRTGGKEPLKYFERKKKKNSRRVKGW